MLYAIGLKDSVQILMSNFSVFEECFSKKNQTRLSLFIKGLKYCFDSNTELT